MKNPYKVSIGLPVFGVAKYIERCVRSLFEQTYENIEYIFVDDCTPDNSIDVLKRVLEEYPKRKEQVRIIRHEKNQGVAAARNTLIDNSHGEFSWQVDPDDYIELDAVEKLVRKQQETNDDFVIMGYTMIHPAGHKSIEHVPDIEKEELLKRVLDGSIAHGMWSYFVRTLLYKKYNICTIEGCNMAEDYWVVPRLVYFADKVSILDEPLYVYVNTNDSSYTNITTYEKETQYQRNLNCVRDFFYEKDNALVEYIDQNEADGIARCLARLARIGGQADMFMMKRSEVSKIQKKYLKHVPLQYRVFCFIDNYTILHIYASLCAIVKHLLEIRHK